MLAAVRRHLRIVIAVVIGVVVLLVVRRLLGAGSSGSAAAPPGRSPAQHDRPVVVQRAPVADPAPAAPDPAPATTEPADPAPSSSGGDHTWVPPTDDGSCPLSHPVKAKASSGIYHVEGGLSYARTSADRCYASPASAEADGYRAAKR